MSVIPKNVPLAWVAAAVTTGIVADRFASVPLVLAIALAGASIVAYLIVRGARNVGSGFLLLTAAALGSAYHRVSQESLASDNLARLASLEGTPVEIRGRIA